MKLSAYRLQVAMLLLGHSFLAGQTVVNGGRVQIGSWDASGATHTLPAKRGTIAQLPASCTQGEQYFATDAAAGQNMYYCTAANVWTPGGVSTFLQAGAGAQARTVTAKLQDVVHVKDFGAKGDGATDDSGAFAAALASGAGEVRADGGTYVINSVITVAKGQKIYFGVGTHTVAGIRFSDSTTDQTGTGKIECAGSGQSTLQLKNSANQDVISQTNFSALTGQNSKFGLFRGEVRGCTVDGNKTHQTAASYGVRLYGHGLQMSDVMVRNAYSDGIYTEWGVDSTFATPSDDLEGYFYGVRAAFNGGNGWTFRGPHDSDFVNVVLYQNGGWGLQVQTSGTYNGNGHLSNINAFLNTLGGIYSNSSLDGSQIAATTGSGWGMLIDSGAGSHNLSSTQFSGPTGLEIRAPSQIVSGNISNTTTAGLRLNGGSGNFSLQMFNNTGYQIDFASEVGPSVLFVNSANPVPGTMFNGAPGQADFVFMDFGGGGTNRYIGLPLQTVHVAGWSPQFPQSNATMAVVNDNSQTGSLHATNLSLSSSAQVGSATFANLGTPADGSILYCADCQQTAPCMAGGAGAMATHAGGAWSCGGGGGGSGFTFRDNLTNTAGTVDFNPLDATVFNLVDEFMPSRTDSGMIGALGWGTNTIGAGFSAAFDAAIPSHPGIFRCQANGSAGAGCAVTLSDSWNAAIYAIPNLGSSGAFAYWETQSVVRTDQYNLSTGKYLVGFADTQASYHPANGNSIAVRWDGGGGGCGAGESTVDWVYEVSVAGVRTCVDSGVPVAINTWYKMRIYSTTPGTINFQINGANSGTIGTAPTVSLTPQFITISGGATQSLSMDWFAMKIRGISR